MSTHQIGFDGQLTIHQSTTGLSGVIADGYAEKNRRIEQNFRNPTPPNKWGDKADFLNIISSALNLTSMLLPGSSTNVNIMDFRLEFFNQADMVLIPYHVDARKNVFLKKNLNPIMPGEKSEIEGKISVASSQLDTTVLTVYFEAISVDPDTLETYTSPESVYDNKTGTRLGIAMTVAMDMQHRFYVESITMKNTKYVFATRLIDELKGAHFSRYHDSRAPTFAISTMPARLKYTNTGLHYGDATLSVTFHPSYEVLTRPKSIETTDIKPPIKYDDGSTDAIFWGVGWIGSGHEILALDILCKILRQAQADRQDTTPNAPIMAVVGALMSLTSSASGLSSAIAGGRGPRPEDKQIYVTVHNRLKFPVFFTSIEHSTGPSSGVIHPNGAESFKILQFFSKKEIDCLFKIILPDGDGTPRYETVILVKEHTGENIIRVESVNSATNPYKSTSQSVRHGVYRKEVLPFNSNYISLLCNINTEGNDGNIDVYIIGNF